MCNKSTKNNFLAANITNAGPAQVKLSLSRTTILHLTSHLTARRQQLDPDWTTNKKIPSFLMFCLTSAPFIPCSHAALCFWNNTYTIHTSTHRYKLNVGKYWHSPADATWSASWGIISQRCNRSLIPRSHETQTHFTSVNVVVFCSQQQWETVKIELNQMHQPLS